MVSSLLKSRLFLVALSSIVFISLIFWLNTLPDSSPCNIVTIKQVATPEEGSVSDFSNSNEGGLYLEWKWKLRVNWSKKNYEKWLDDNLSEDFTKIIDSDRLIYKKVNQGDIYKLTVLNAKNIETSFSISYRCDPW